MKVRERILHMDLIPKVIHLKLFFDIVPSSSADILFSLCVDSIFVEDLFLSFRSFQSKGNLQRSGDRCLRYFDYKQRSFGSRYV